MEERIYTHIIYKHDTKDKWANSSFIPYPGELIVYDADDEYPYQRLKIGDGITPVTKLDFVIDNSVFIGTRNEYQTAYDLGTIVDGTIVVLTDE